MKPLKFLQVCWYQVFPAIDGGQKDIAHFFEALRKQVEVNFICSNDNEVVHKNILPKLNTGKLQLLQFMNYRKILRCIQAQKTTHVIIEHPYYFLLLFWRKKMGYKLIYSSHNVEYQRLKELRRWYWPLVRWMEQYLVKRCDYILAKTAEDKTFFRQKWKANCPIQIIPYCINQPKLIPTKMESRGKLGWDINSRCALFVANFEYEPNLSAAKHLVTEIVPLVHEVKFMIVGKGASGIHCSNSNVQVYDYVDSLAEYYAAADVFVNPVTKGAGIQTKNIEALSYGLPIVCYSNRAQGLPTSFMKDAIMKVDHSASFANCIQQVPASKDVSPEFYMEYSWDVHLAQFIENMRR
jgi:glycosyltransferase involved in cell wall biosynthesis